MNTACSLRKQMIARRKALDVDEIQQKSKRISQHLSCFEGFRDAEHVALYLSLSGEADTAGLLENSEESDREFYLPVLHRTKENELHFIKMDEKSEFTTNKFGITEPKYSAQEEIKASKLDMVIMPLVSFDKQGNRIGMGGGYYDRTFAFKQQGKNGLKPLLVGYAYEFQYSDRIKPEYWDVKMDGVVTENGFFHC